MWMIRVFRGHPTDFLMLSGSRAQQSEVIETMTGACRPYNLGGSATTLHQNDGLSVKMTNNGSAKDG
jgi:hypothetical protein